MDHLRSCALCICLPLLAACGADAREPSDGPAEAESARVWFESPLDGDTLAGPDVLIRFGHSGVRLVPPDVPRPGEAHHHLFVNVDVTPAGEVIPAGWPGIVHMGDASSEYLLTGLEPGEYRLISVLADGVHVPLAVPAQDTVFIVVKDG